MRVLARKWQVEMLDAAAAQPLATVWTMVMKTAKSPGQDRDIETMIWKTKQMRFREDADAMKMMRMSRDDGAKMKTQMRKEKRMKMGKAARTVTTKTRTTRRTMRMRTSNK